MRMGDISEAMMILSDKIGIGVDTLYQLNLQVQTIKAVSNAITIISILVMITISAIIICRWDSRNPYSIFDESEGKVFLFCIIAVCIIVGCFLLQLCIEETALRIFAPQYMAMKDTISMIGTVI